MEEEKMNSKKKAMLICSITVLAVILIVGISYAFWQVTKVQEETNVIASGCLNITLEGNKAINLNSVYPITKEEGMKTTPYSFTLTNTCNNEVNYIVNLESLQETTFQNTSIRVEIDNEATSKNKLYSNYTEANKYFDTSKEARTLVSGTLGNNGTIAYNLRMWIDEDTPNTEQNKIFKSKIVATAGSNIELVQDFTDIVKVGDFISMTPTSTSYTPPGELTGCMNDANCTQNTLNPSELNLWRVIKRNNDGTVDMVSVYASSKVVRFRGIVGYMNYVGALNTIASQYTNEKYVERTRYMGYKNQIEYCTDYKVDSCPVDDRKSEDYNLVESILGGIGTLPINGEEHPRYWLPNRMGFFSPRPSGDGYIIDDICTKGDNYLGTQGSRRITSGTETNPVDVTTESSVRPVVSLKSSVFLKNGDGKSAETAYTLV